MSIVFYVTNYAMKVEDPVWKHVAAAAEVFNVTNTQKLTGFNGTGLTTDPFILGVKLR